MSQSSQRRRLSPGCMGRRSLGPSTATGCDGCSWARSFSKGARLSRIGFSRFGKRFHTLTRIQCFDYDPKWSGPVRSRFLVILFPNSWMNRADDMVPSGGVGKGTGKRLAAQRPGKADCMQVMQSNVDVFPQTVWPH